SVPDQTRRRFGGRHPLCGIGVTSLIKVISKPTACRLRIAASRPLPGPFTKISTLFNPCSMAFFAHCSAASCAANGVLFRDPLNPLVPLEAHAIVFPYLSLIFTIVLLKLANR